MVENHPKPLVFGYLAYVKIFDNCRSRNGRHLLILSDPIPNYGDV